MTKKILTWRERCQIHPEHQGGAIATSRMIERRMQEEIDELRAEWEKACAKMSGHEPEQRVAIPWGMWRLDGSWEPNPNLAMSADEQYRQNVANGFIKPSSQNREAKA